MLDHWLSPSWLQHFLFENPWPVLAVFGVLALIFAWHALRRRSRGLWIAAGCCAIVAAVAPLLSHLVTTTREKLMALDDQLVHAVAPDPDMPTLTALFSPTIDFQITRSISQSQEIQPLLELIGRVDRKYQLHNVTLLANDARARIEGSDLAESYFQVRVTLTPTDEGVFSGSDMAVTTDWLCQWQRQPDGSFKIVTLRWLKIDGRDPTASMLP